MTENEAREALMCMLDRFTPSRLRTLVDEAVAAHRGEPGYCRTCGRPCGSLEPPQPCCTQG